MRIYYQSILACLSLALGIIPPSNSAAQDFRNEAARVCWNYFTSVWRQHGQNWVYPQYQTEATGVTVRANQGPMQEVDRLNGIHWKGLVQVFATATRAGGSDWRQGGELFNCSLTFRGNRWQGHASDNVSLRIRQF
jgi:hypothetical protein